MPTIAYQPIPRALTAPIAMPTPPESRCMLDGKPAVCVLDALALIPLYQGAIEACNADRARTALLGVSDGR